MSDLMPRKVLMRAVFDLGSGTIKLNISRLVIKSALSAGAGSECVIDACVHEAEEEFRLGAMVLKSGNSSITGDASEALTYIIHKMLNDAASAGYHLANTQPLKHCDAIATVAAATAVYRLAINGASVLQQLQNHFKFPFLLVPHELEGALGHATAVAASGRPASQIASLDVGGGSFQMCLPKIMASVPASADGPPELLMCNVAIGSSHAAHLLMKQQQQQQCGPASLSDMESLIAELVSSITAASFTNSDADRNLVDVHVMTTASAALDRLTIIGGSFCAGRMASLLMQREDFTPEELMKCMGERLGTLSIDAIEKLGLPQPDIVIPKLCLLIAVMRACGMSRGCYLRTLGNTPALLTMPLLWDSRSN